MLDSADNNIIIDLIQVAAFRVGVCLQMPTLAVWPIHKIFTPNVRKLRDQYFSVSRALAVDRMNTDSKRQDLFSHILAAKDPQTGRGFTMDGIWGESTLLIVAGISPRRPSKMWSLQTSDIRQVPMLSRPGWQPVSTTWAVARTHTQRPVLKCSPYSAQQTMFEAETN